MRKYIALSLLTCISGSAFSQTATYIFDHNFHAQESGVGDLTAVDPFSQNSFSSVSIYGGTHTSYDMFGAKGNHANAGVIFDDSSNLVNPASYSLELVMAFNGNAGGWKKIADFSNRTSDLGLYNDTAQRLDLFNTGGGPDNFSIGFHVFHYVAMTFDGSSYATYLDGNLQKTGVSNIPNIGNNAGHLINFFMDDAATGFGEYSDSSVALLRLSNGVLSAGDIANRAPNPFGGAAVPEPTTMALIAVGLGSLARRKRK